MNNISVFLILGGIIIFGIISFNTYERLKSATDNSVNYYTGTQARNICNSAVGTLISDLADNTSWRVKTVASRSYDEGFISYTIKDTILNGENRIEVFCAARVAESYDTIIAYVKPPEDGFIPACLRAAITTNNPTSTLGNIEIDGRNYKLTGELIPNSGTLGMWSTNIISQGGSSTIGGTYNGVDYAPTRPANVNVIAMNQTWPGGYPDSPDKVLGESNGFPEGKLMQIAKSGAGGSQYVTNPNNLTFPLKGVTYVELPANPKKNSWKAQNIQGSGILVVHNSALDAKIENLNSGTFTGLLIADDIVHIHTNIIGAVVGLTPSPSEGNCIGNGNGSVKFSSEAVMKATKDVSPSTAAKNFGFGKYRLEVTDWFEKN